MMFLYFGRRTPVSAGAAAGPAHQKLSVFVSLSSGDSSGSRTWVHIFADFSFPGRVGRFSKNLCNVVLQGR